MWGRGGGRRGCVRARLRLFLSLSFSISFSHWFALSLSLSLSLTLSLISISLSHTNCLSLICPPLSCIKDSPSLSPPLSLSPTLSLTPSLSPPSLSLLYYGCGIVWLSAELKRERESERERQRKRDRDREREWILHSFTQRRTFLEFVCVCVVL